MTGEWRPIDQRVLFRALGMAVALAAFPAKDRDIQDDVAEACAARIERFATAIASDTATSSESPSI